MPILFREDATVWAREDATVWAREDATVWAREDATVWAREQSSLLSKDQRTPMTVLPQRHRTVVIGDLHGDVGMMCASLFLAEVIDKQFQWIAQPPDTVVVQMGDQVDSLTRAEGGEGQAPLSWERLPDVSVVEFMQRIDEIARPHGGRVISLLGNHEIMNVIGDFSYVSPHSIERTGGPAMRHALFRPGGTLATLLSQRPLVAKVGSVVFAHAGLLPHHWDVFPSIDAMNTAVAAWLRGDDASPLVPQWLMDPASPVWTRFYGEAADTDVAPQLQTALQRAHAQAMVVGHQPQPRIQTRFNGRLWLTDVGISRAFGNFNPTLSVLEIFQNNDTVEFRVRSTNKN